MKDKLLPAALALLGLTVTATALAQDAVKISGLAYMDYDYTISSSDSEEEGENGFGYRRLYLTSDFTISDDFSARARLEASDSSTNSDGKPAPFIKDLYLRWKNSFADGHDIYLGISSAAVIYGGRESLGLPQSGKDHPGSCQYRLVT